MARALSSGSRTRPPRGEASAGTLGVPRDQQQAQETSIKPQVTLHEAVLIEDRYDALIAAYTCLKAGQDVNGKDKEGRTPLHLLAWKNPEPAAVRSLIAALLAEGADLHAKDEKQHAAPLHVAALNNSAAAAAAAISALLAAGADAQMQAGPYDIQPIHFAVLNSNPQAAIAAIQALVEAGADVLASAGGGIHPPHLAASQPLHLAAIECKAAAASLIIQSLLAAGADVRAATATGHQPLHCAALNQDPEAAAATAEALLEAGADPRACDKEGRLPLQLALERPDVEACRRLVWLLVPSSKRSSAAGSINNELLAKLATLLKGPQLERSGSSGGSSQCVVFLDAPRAVLLLPCRHLALCEGCAARREARSKCPICRQVVATTINVLIP